VGDCVEGILASLRAPTGETYNVGGGETVSVLDVIRKLERLVGRPALVRHGEARKGDQRQTFADCTKLFRHTGWRPATGIDEGLALQIQWQAGAGLKAAA
jgi:nucleoside-diphosphate-sugar epimerase